MQVITWPSIIKYTGEDELTFVASQEEWEADADLHAFTYEADDRLVDSSGGVFYFEYENNSVYLKSAGQALEPDAVVELIRKHASQLGNCCVAKLFFPSIQEALAAVEDMQA